MKKFDAAIAGGGLIGAAIALELSRAGMRIGLFDRQQPGQEASWASAGILSPAPENPASVAMVPLGKASLALYPEFIAQIEEISGMSTGFRAKGTLEALFSRDTKAELSTIIALHHGLGLRAEPLGQLREIAGDLFAFGIIGHERTQIAFVLAQQRAQRPRCAPGSLRPAAGLAGCQ